AAAMVRKSRRPVHCSAGGVPWPQQLVNRRRAIRKGRMGFSRVPEPPRFKRVRRTSTRECDFRTPLHPVKAVRPVFLRGGLIWTGDSHCEQGNGELKLTALEVVECIGQ